ncbi:MAG: tetratricopeptide repeat protein [Dongiaceae bacterium]
MTTGPLPPAVPGERPLARAIQLVDEGRLDDAARVCHRILAQDPGNAPALHLLGAVWHKGGRPLLGIEMLKKAVAHDPSLALAHRNLCEMYRLEHRLDEAVEAGERTLALTPNDGHAHYFLSMVHYERGDAERAIAHARRSVALLPNFPGAHFELAEALLVSGRLREGFVEYEWRHQLKSVPPLLSPRPLQPLWDGRPLGEGELLLVADQGFGDVIQFCRYIPTVAERAKGFVIACNPEVRPILEQQPGVGRVIVAPQGLPAFGYWTPLSTLPMILGTELDTIPGGIPYIRTEPEKVAQWGARIAAAVPAGHLKVGIVWAGRPTHGNDRNRSTQLRSFAPLAALEGVALLSLQMGPPQLQIESYDGRAPLVDLGRDIRTFADSAGILANLDLTIAVDTSIVHLAGAMGRPVWTLLAQPPDWRWLLGRADTPWYPSMRLFRQPAPGAWRPVMEEVAAALAARRAAA